MEYLGIIGFMLFGYLLPEFLTVLGNSDIGFTVWLNILSTVSAGLIATPFLIN